MTIKRISENRFHIRLKPEPPKPKMLEFNWLSISLSLIEEHELAGARIIMHPPSGEERIRIWGRNEER